MDSGLYVGLSSQMALERRLNTLAHNVANTNTTGFRAGKIRFEEVLDGVTKTSTSFVSQGQSFLSPVSGGIEETGAALDFAVKGDAWFSVNTPEGTIVTRDGRFKMQETGELVTIDGHAVLDSGGAAVQLNPAGGRPEVGGDGVITQGGATVGSIGLFEYQPGPNYRRYGNSGIIAETPPEPVVDRSDVGIVQGFVEQSNVNPVAEMSKLISVHRAFDNVAALIRDSEGALEEAIKTLGGGR